MNKFKKWKDMLAILNLKFASFFENEEKDSIFYRALCQGIGETVKVMRQERTFFLQYMHHYVDLTNNVFIHYIEN